MLVWLGFFPPLFSRHNLLEISRLYLLDFQSDLKETVGVQPNCRTMGMKIRRARCLSRVAVNPRVPLAVPWGPVPSALMPRCSITRLMSQTWEKFPRARECQQAEDLFVK